MAKAQEKKDGLSFEAAADRLEKIVELLEAGEAPLEESLKLYEEGARLAAFCSEKLRAAEQTITLVTGAKGTGAPGDGE